jgi:branched-chain amino acid transport system substrate-binding protein
MRSLLVCLLLAALPALSALPARSALAQPALTVGAALPQSGILADLAADYRKALLLWQEETNARGGLLGRRVELLLLDDRSESADAGKLYQQLIREHKADLLLGPFGSAASLGAAAVAERGRRVMVNATGAGRLVHKSGFRYVFQSAIPFGSYATSALELARAQGVKRILVLGRDDPASREMVARAREEAGGLGLVAGEAEIYSQGASDFALQVAKARAANVDAWIAFGLPQDAAEMVKSFRRLDYAPRLFLAQGAAQPDFIARVGQDAEYAVGITPYERRVSQRGSADFAQAYAKKWSAEPSLLAVEGYAAGKVLEAAVQRAGAIDQEKLREVLAALETETPLGPYKVDRGGVQVAARPLLVQILRGRREIVWPEAFATAKLQPYPAWDARKLLK